MILSTQPIESKISQSIARILREKLSRSIRAEMRVAGNSMGWSAPIGSAVVFKACDAQALKPGDILVLAGNHSFLIHRLKRIERRRGEWRLITQGDASPFEDLPFPPGSVLGKVVAVRLKKRSIHLENGAGAFEDRLRRVLTLAQRKSLKLRGALKEWVAFHQGNAWVRWASRGAYWLSIRIAVLVLGRIPSVDDVILFRSLAHDDWTPGLSDVDLWVTVRGSRDQDIRKVSEVLARLQRVFPFLTGVMVSPVEYLEDWKKYGGVRALEAGRWKSLLRKKRISCEYNPDSARLGFDVLHEIYWILGLIFSELRTFLSGRQSERIFRTQLKKQIIDFYRAWALLSPGSAGFVNRREFVQQNPEHPVWLLFDRLEAAKTNLARAKAYRAIYGLLLEDVEAALSEAALQAKDWGLLDHSARAESFSRSQEFQVESVGRMGVVLVFDQITRFSSYFRALRRLVFSGDLAWVSLMVSKRAWSSLSRGLGVPMRGASREILWSYVIRFQWDAYATVYSIRQKKIQNHLNYAFGALHRVLGQESPLSLSGSWDLLAQETQKARKLTFETHTDTLLA